MLNKDVAIFGSRMLLLFLKVNVPRSFASIEFDDS